MAELVKLIVELGLETYKAVKEGNRSKTVGEIFDGVPKDMSKIRELEDEAREHFERRS